MTIPKAARKVLAEKPPETYRALIIIKNTLHVASHWLYKIHICHSVFVSHIRNCAVAVPHLLQTSSIWPYNVKTFRVSRKVLGLIVCDNFAF
jgi:hypothetical protein